MQALQLTLTSLNPDLYPAYDYDTLQEFKRDHVLTFQFHYRDCDCFACYSAHFPCENPLCDYCDSVRRLKNEGYKIEKEIQGIIDYATYVAVGYEGSSGDNGATFDTNYDLHDMLWRTCDNGDCRMLMDGKTADLYDGSYCSQECMDAVAEEEEEEEESPECAWCGSRMSEEDGNGIICDDCLQNSDHGYEISLDDTEYYDELWIGPDGTFYAVSEDSGGHGSACQVMGYRNTDECENAGYVHLTNCYGHDFEYIPNYPSQALIDAIIDLCDLKGWELPEEIADLVKKSDCDMSEESQEFDYDRYAESRKMQDLSKAWLSAPRSIRDQFYKLSGD